MLASIIIPTYSRSDMLRRAVRSCLGQSGGFDFEIIVVDNNPDGSAAAVVTALAAESATPIRYINEPRPGISHARNTGVAAAQGRFLAFLDDDMEATPDWLDAHLTAQRRFGADVTFGPKLPLFPASVNSVPPLAYRIFARYDKIPTGSAMPRYSPLLGVPGIGNTVLDRSRCIVDAAPFDPEYGLTGGEDTLFFRQLLAQRCKMIWCAEAIVRETHPAERVSQRYLLRRAFNNGQISAGTWGALNPPARGRMVMVMTAGVVQASLFVVPALACRVINHPRWLSYAGNVMGGLGKVLCQWKTLRPMYRPHPPLLRNPELRSEPGNLASPQPDGH